MIKRAFYYCKDKLHNSLMWFYKKINKNPELEEEKKKLEEEKKKLEKGNNESEEGNNESEEGNNESEEGNNESEKVSEENSNVYESNIKEYIQTPDKILKWFYNYRKRNYTEEFIQETYNYNSEQRNMYLIAHNHLYRHLSIIKGQVISLVIIFVLIVSILIGWNLICSLANQWIDSNNFFLPITIINTFIKDHESLFLGGGLITVFFAGLKIYRSRISDMKKQSNWRGKVYEMEQKPLTSYRLNDLFTINSFINPYTSTGSASFIVNEMIYNLYLGREKVVELCRYEMLDILNTNFFKIHLPSYHSLLSLKEEDLKPNRLLTREEAINAKLCCHLLLKAEWENKI